MSTELSCWLDPQVGTAGRPAPGPHRLDDPEMEVREPRPPRVIAPPARALWIVRTLIVMALVQLALFLGWLLQPDHRGDWLPFWLLTAGLGFKIFRWLNTWYQYWSVQEVPPLRTRRAWTVDVFTTACPGEPHDMIERTLRAMVRMRLPHRNFLCDEGNDPQLRALCRQLGVTHVTRSDRRDAKAGNINNALRQSNGEICVVLDPDHEPCPSMLENVLGYFEDQGVGFVQTVQGYRNQGASLIARGAAEQTYHFYGAMMMGMHHYGVVQAIGANCAFRRTALESIGGHAPGLAEDMHTAMRLYAKGWRSVYVPEMLTRGLVPSSLSAYYKQQLKWACGCFDLLLYVYPRLFRRLTLQQRVHYFCRPLYYARGLFGLIDVAVPILCLTGGFVGWRIAPLEFAVWFMPLLSLSALIHYATQWWLLEPTEQGSHVLGGILKAGTWWVHLTGIVCSICRIRVPYIPTPKEDVSENAWLLSVPNAAVALFSVGAIAYGLSRDWSPHNLLMAIFAGWNAAALGFVALISQKKAGEDLRALANRGAARSRARVAAVTTAFDYGSSS
jgi:cellulose synthase (UDP-forming)